MKRRLTAALALAGLLMTMNTYAEDAVLPGATQAPAVSAAPTATAEAATTPVATAEATATPTVTTVPAATPEATATPQPVPTLAPTMIPGSANTLKVTREYRWFVNQYRNTRGVTVQYYDNVYARNHGKSYLTPFDSTVPPEYFVVDETGAYALAPIVLDITDAMRTRLYGGDLGETVMYYGQYCERVNGKYGRTGFSGVHEGIDFKYMEGAPLHAILGGVVTRAGDSNGTVAIYNEQYDCTLLYLHCEKISVHRGDEVEAGALIAKEGGKNSGGVYTHVEFRFTRHTSSSPYRDTKLTSDCPYPTLRVALGVTDSGRQVPTFGEAERQRIAAEEAARLAEEARIAAERLKQEEEAAAKAEAERLRLEAEAEAERLRLEAEAAARAEEEARKAAEEAAKQEEEATQDPPIELIDNLPSANGGYGFGTATAAPESTATAVPEATLPPARQ